MGMYIQKEVDFVKRTRKILQDYKGDYKVTLLINCCVGLLIVPKEKWYNDLPTDTVNQKDLGIAPSDIKIETSPSIKKVVRHLRNSVAHYRYTFIDSPTKKIEGIKFTDEDSRIGRDNFELTISVENLRRFLDKFSQSMLEKMEKSKGT